MDRKKLLKEMYELCIFTLVFLLSFSASSKVLICRDCELNDIIVCRNSNSGHYSRVSLPGGEHHWSFGCLQGGCRP